MGRGLLRKIQEGPGQPIYLPDEPSCSRGPRAMRWKDGTCHPPGSGHLPGHLGSTWGGGVTELGARDGEQPPELCGRVPGASTRDTWLPRGRPPYALRLAAGRAQWGWAQDNGGCFGLAEWGQCHFCLGGVYRASGRGGRPHSSFWNSVLQSRVFTPASCLPFAWRLLLVFRKPG